MPQLRENIITGDWVVITPERAKRPSDYKVDSAPILSEKDSCPFCPGTDGYRANSHVRGAETEHFYVIKNKYPAFLEGEEHASVRSYYPEKGFYRARAAIGAHEVVVAKNHDQNLITLTANEIAEMMKVFCHRYEDLKKDPNVISIMPIYNHGSSAGASISHPHAQIFASPVVANTVGRELTGAEEYYGINGSCVFCDIIAHEKKEQIRVVSENRNFLAATFYAARFPLETWIYPKRHDSQFENTPHHELLDLAEVLLDVLKRMERNIPHIPLNFYIHTLPTIHSKSYSYHWHLEITPRLANYGGYELGSGVIIDIMSPEDAAEYLRKPNSNKI